MIHWHEPHTFEELAVAQTGTLTSMQVPTVCSLSSSPSLRMLVSSQLPCDFVPHSCLVTLFTSTAAIVTLFLTAVQRASCGVQTAAAGVSHTLDICWSGGD